MSVSGQEDSQFDAGDAIEFYGLGLDESWTDTRVYWLVVGARPGQRITLVSAPGGQPSGSSFPYTMERKDRSVYFSALRHGERENFFGAVVGSEPVAASLQVPHLDPVSPGTPVLAVREVSGVVTSQDAGYAVTLTVPESGTRTWLTFTPAQAKPVAAVTAKRPSHVRTARLYHTG
jgi:hypothetical protein